MGIRFIAINDNYDSKDYVGIGEIDVQFKALLYDFYSKDLSQKVSTAVGKKGQRYVHRYLCSFVMSNQEPSRELLWMRK